MYDALYLDYARFGLATPSAQMALTDFGRLTTEVGFSLYYQQFLQHGFDAFPQKFQCRYGGLKHWQGVGEFKRRIAELAGLSQTQVFLASRSSELMKLAARLLTRHCRRILVSDLAWPGFMRLLGSKVCRSESVTIAVPLRDAILHESATAGDVVDIVVASFLLSDCDGLFLPAISHDGISLPLGSILKRLREIKPGAFLVVDGAQHFAHVPKMVPQACDFYITGAHKWLRGGSPLGIGLAPRIDSLSRAWRAGARSRDPLFEFISGLETDALESFSETVNLAPLFSARAALADHLRSDSALKESFGNRVHNVHQVAAAAADVGWRVQAAYGRHDSGILRLRAPSITHVACSKGRYERLFAEAGLTVTCYEGGVVRLSMPDVLLSDSQVEQIASALHSVGRQALPKRHDRVQLSDVTKLG